MTELERFLIEVPRLHLRDYKNLGIDNFRQQNDIQFDAHRVNNLAIYFQRGAPR